MYYFDVEVNDTFDVEKTLECGQCFHFIKKSEKNYIVFGANTYCEILQRNNQVRIWTDMDKEGYWKDYFAFTENYDKIIAGLRNHCIACGDDFGLYAIEQGKGIRILHQPFFEVSCSYILSQQNNIPRIKKMVFNLSNEYGIFACDYNGVPYSTFPWVKKLQKVSVEELEKWGLGYRAKYLYEFCQNWFQVMDKVKFDYDNDFKVLKSCYGIGDKVANCICLYGFNETDAFPVDTWMKKILKEEYFDKGRVFKMPDKNAGILQQFMFYTKRLEK